MILIIGATPSGSQRLLHHIFAKSREEELLQLIEQYRRKIPPFAQGIAYQDGEVPLHHQHTIMRSDL